MARLDDVDVVAENGSCMSLREAGAAWEAGEFSDWVRENGLPLTIGTASARRMDEVEDLLSDAAFARGGW